MAPSDLLKFVSYSVRLLLLLLSLCLLLLDAFTIIASKLPPTGDLRIPPAGSFTW